MHRIHKFAAVGVGSLLVVFALTGAALAAGGARQESSRSAIVLIPAKGAPNSNIKGKPAHWSPKKLKGKSELTGSQCTSAEVTFFMTNDTSATQLVTITGKNLETAQGDISPGQQGGDCIQKGYHGTVHAALTDGKKLTVKVK